MPNQNNIDNNRTIFSTLGTIALLAAVVWGFNAFGDGRNRDNVANDAPLGADNRGGGDPDDIANRNFMYSGMLRDVTGGMMVRSIMTNGRSAGTVRAGMENNEYYLFGTFNDLSDPENGEFYEGWVVKKTENGMEPVSTGRLEKRDGMYVNAFTSERDLTEHMMYVLTIEPDDGNPAPADHILEGNLQKM